MTKPLLGLPADPLARYQRTSQVSGRIAIALLVLGGALIVLWLALGDNSVPVAAPEYAAALGFHAILSIVYAVWGYTTARATGKWSKREAIMLISGVYLMAGLPLLLTFAYMAFSA